MKTRIFRSLIAVLAMLPVILVLLSTFRTGDIPATDAVELVGRNALDSAIIDFMGAVGLVEDSTCTYQSYTMLSATTYLCAYEFITFLVDAIMLVPRLVQKFMRGFFDDD